MPSLGEVMTTQLPPYPDFDLDGIGPAVGAPFPSVVLPDQQGERVDLHAARAGRRALVLFHRSASW